MYLFYFFGVLAVATGGRVRSFVSRLLFSQTPMRLTRLLLPLMFCCLLIAICGTMFSSNCSLLEPGPPPRCAACMLYEVVDFWVRDPLAVLV